MTHDPLGNPVDRAPPVEPAHQPRAAEAGLRRQVQLGDVAPLVRRQGPPRPRHRRRAARPAVVHRAGRPRRHRLRQGHRPQRADQPARRPRSSPRSASSGRSRSGATRIERNRARTYFQAYAAACALHFAEKALAEVRAGRTKTWEPFKVPDEAHRLRVHRGGPRRALAPHGDPRRQDRQLPPVPADAVERQPPRRLRHARARTRTRCRDTPIFEENDRGATSRASTSCAPSAASTRACPAASTCTSATARRSR